MRVLVRWIPRLLACVFRENARGESRFEALEAAGRLMGIDWALVWKPGFSASRFLVEQVVIKK